VLFPIPPLLFIKTKWNFGKNKTLRINENFILLILCRMALWVL